MVDSIINLLVMSLKAELPFSKISERYAAELMAAEMPFNKEMYGRANNEQCRRKWTLHLSYRHKWY